MTRIQLQDLRKEFDDVTAVDGIDLTIEDGEFLVIVGPSGCGKSTTLRLLAGLEHATDGRIRMNDRDVTGIEPKNRNIAMVFQNYALYPHMTGRRNISFGMKSAGEFTDREIEKRVDQASETLDIADLLDRKPQAMSGGERQRVALGRAIVRDPDAFLMDEPLSNLDAKLRIQMRAELTKLHSELGTTTVYVTHDQTEAMTLGERVVVMEDGRIMQVDTPQVLYDFPEHRFVAEFIGDPAMNMIDVSLETGSAVHDAFRLPLPTGGAYSEEWTEANRAAVLGIRPEDLYLAKERPNLGQTTFTATVDVTEPLGDSLLLHCSVGESKFKMEAEPRATIEPADEIEVMYDPARLHLFDPETGECRYHSEQSTASLERIENTPEP
ncbi:multiple sugar transport system ATP-binding protein [Halohasta litchfieldiae]|jgi:multiple sugar transport system ATP-binding protein|uniref:ABC-type D-xylose/L-arabinose transporter n=1 Tax=Halohasta litchfieldiae TaxID=1073996 RepID=A0A1H6UHB9_9EURY|nr:ABC transporter ATP-binding protein [Halohasta litchfieldiae]ATW89099.1 multiple sugar transport system ATP-binding protein [Halohasta litchfieldiae]SEI87192.1 carbohydrate ABC transporter ATP-binding protein, CUT1 family [Halohasta litchfieldiae]